MYSFHAVGSKEATDWVAERALKFLRGESADVVAAPRQSLNLVKLSSEKRKVVDKCANYLEK